MFDIDSVSISSTRVPVQKAAINATSSGDNVLVAAVPGKSIYLLRFLFNPSAPVTVQLFSNNSSGTLLMGPMPLLQSQGDAAGPGTYVTKTNVGESLVLNLSGAVTVGGLLTFAVA
jgi:hypothetical protein